MAPNQKVYVEKCQRGNFSALPPLFDEIFVFKEDLFSANQGLDSWGATHKMTNRNKMCFLQSTFHCFLCLVQGNSQSFVLILIYFYHKWRWLKYFLCGHELIDFCWLFWKIIWFFQLQCNQCVVSDKTYDKNICFIIFNHSNLFESKKSLVKKHQ